MKHIDTIIFDFDGTICDSLHAGFRIANKLSYKYNFKKVDENELPNFRDMNSKQVIQALGISYFKLPWIAKSFRKLLNAEISTLKPFDNIIDEIKQLHLIGYRLGILSSNSKENVYQFLANHQIDHCFSFIQTGSSLFGKPGIIKKLIRRQKLTKEQVLLVGDETRDIEAAHSCGIRVVAVSWGFHTKAVLQEYQPDYLIESPTELNELLRNH